MSDRKQSWLALLVASGLAAASQSALAAIPAESIALLAKGEVGEAGQEPLRLAWKRVTAGGADEVFVVLGGMKGATRTGENWLRSACDAILERQLQSEGKLPAKELEAFVLDQAQAPRARRTAFEWLSRVDETATGRLLPQMFADSSLEMRFDAVQQALEAAEAAPGEDAKAPLYRQALTSARDVGQIKKCTEALEKLGEKVDLVQQMGFLTKWRLVGPFDNTDLKGFATAYPPESQLDYDAALPGKAGEVRWIEHQTEDGYGKLDLNKAVFDDKDMVVYAVAKFTVPAARTAQLRLGSPNATKVWHNGKEVGSHEVYHAGFEIDQYQMPVELKAGENLVLVKVCQNPREEFWEKDCTFQLRVTDDLGGAIELEREK